MIISSNDFGSFNLRILPGFKPVTKPALKWKQLANGSNIVVDRTKSSDIYEAEISIYGEESAVDILISELENNRRSTKPGANTFSLSGFNEAEKIFGAEIDYSYNITATVIKFGEKEQKTLRGFSLKLTLRALNDTITPRADIAAVFPEINGLSQHHDAGAFLAVGYTADSVIDMDIGDSYSGTLNFSDTRADSGFFEGTFTLKTDDMARLRKFLLCENRGQVIEAGSSAGQFFNAIPGVENLFGKRRNGPFNVRIIEWSDMGMRSLGFWQIKMKIVEEI